MVLAVRVALPLQHVGGSPFSTFINAKAKLLVTSAPGASHEAFNDALLLFLQRNGSALAQLQQLEVQLAGDLQQYLAPQSLRQLAAACGGLQGLSLLRRCAAGGDAPAQAAACSCPLPAQLSSISVQQFPFPWASIAGLQHLKKLEVAAHGALAPSSLAALGLAGISALEELQLDIRPAWVSAQRRGVFGGAAQLRCTRLRSIDVEDGGQVGRAVAGTTHAALNGTGRRSCSGGGSAAAAVPAQPSPAQSSLPPPCPVSVLACLLPLPRSPPTTFAP
jgi:hypothetical protein